MSEEKESKAVRDEKAVSAEEESLLAGKKARLSSVQPAQSSGQTSSLLKSPGVVGEERQTTVMFTRAPLIEKDPALQPTLEVVSGSANEKIFQLGKEKLTIGRVGYNDIILNDKKVSRSHAAIYFEKGRYVVEDLKSTNGVYVDGSLITKTVLKTGNQVRMGDTVLLFKQSVPEVSMEDKSAFISQSDLFNWLDDESRSLLAGNLTVRFYPKNTTVLKQNTPVESMYFLYSGSIRVVELNEEGGERVIDQINPGDSFGERALLAGESGRYTMIANSDIHVLELQRLQLNELLLKKPELNKAFYRMVLKKFSATPEPGTGDRDHRLEDLKHLTVPTDVEVIGEDKKIKDARKKIETFAKEGKGVLITGPSGT